MRSIVHPTDFSEPSRFAFAHALRVALAAKCRLRVVHVTSDRERPDWKAFPHVRETLAGWGLAGEDDTELTVAQRLGLQVAKIELYGDDATERILEFLERNPSELIVLATHGREGLPRWLSGSVAERIARRSDTQTLFISPVARGFVAKASGAVMLNRILVPVDHDPPAPAALAAIWRFAHLLGVDEAAVRLLHVGEIMPVILKPSDPSVRCPVEMRSGDVVETILQAAMVSNADLIGMPTAGHHGFLDALRGSTTERVLRRAPCPLLAVPAHGLDLP